MRIRTLDGFKAYFIIFPSLAADGSKELTDE